MSEDISKQPRIMYLGKCCEYGVDAHYSPNQEESCGNLPVAEVSWQGNGSMLLCEEHLEIVQSVEGDMWELPCAIDAIKHLERHGWH